MHCTLYNIYYLHYTLETLHTTPTLHQCRSQFYNLDRKAYVIHQLEPHQTRWNIHYFFVQTNHFEAQKLSIGLLVSRILFRRNSRLKQEPPLNSHPWGHSAIHFRHQLGWSCATSFFGLRYVAPDWYLRVSTMCGHHFFKCYNKGYIHIPCSCRRLLFLESQVYSHCAGVVSDRSALPPATWKGH